MVLQISSDRDGQRNLGGGGRVETFNSRTFWGRKIQQVFFWVARLDLSRDFFGYSE